MTLDHPLAARDESSDDDVWWIPPPTWAPQPSMRQPDSETPLWPPPETTDTGDADEPSQIPDSETSRPEKDDPESAVVTEESTITDAMTTKTDSGKTITVPNDEIVTVTRHTTIVTDEPPSSTASGPDSTIAPSRPNQDGPEQTDQPPSDGGASGNSHDSQSGGSLPTGAIVGVGIGGAVIVAFLVIMTIVIKRRLRKQREEQGSGVTGDDLGRDDRFDEKHFPQQMSAHTTGTQASGGDPFAPFGGRADKDTEYPNRPPSNTFEMDAASTAPVELPDTSPELATASGASPLSPVADSSPTDPRANLNSLGAEDGKPKYINYWNQYRSMGSG